MNVRSEDPAMVDQPAHLPDVLLWRAERHPDTVAYEFLDDDNELHALSYAELASRAGAQAEALSGDDGPVLILCPSGLDYVTAVYGCFLAGRPAVPAYPVDAASADGDRLAGVIADAGVTVALTPATGAPAALGGLTLQPVTAADPTAVRGRRRTRAAFRSPTTTWPSTPGRWPAGSGSTPTPAR
jgi:acyl-CoA synthetase (AMP-forming)/AMP-acid ligase II